MISQSDLFNHSANDKNMVSICLSLKHRQYSPMVLVMKRISLSSTYKLTVVVTAYIRHVRAKTRSNTSMERGIKHEDPPSDKE